MTDLNTLAYAAGIFDGSGSVFPVRATRQVRATITGIPDEVGAFLVKNFGGRLERRPNKKNYWILTKKEELLAFLVSVRPYLRAKEFPVDETIAFLYVARPYVKWGPAQQRAWEDCLRMNQ